MGQKTNPILNRIYVSRLPLSIGCTNSKKRYVENTKSDITLRKMVHSQYPGIDRVVIERTAKDAHVIIYCAKPGAIIGKKGADADQMKKKMQNILGTAVHLSIREVKNPDLSANLLSESIALQLEKRVLFRKAMKRAMQSAMRAGAVGIKITVSGRLSGAEIARSETYKEGRVPLHTFRADIDYSLALAHTTYGVIGVKVWVYRGDVFDEQLS